MNDTFLFARLPKAIIPRLDWQLRIRQQCAPRSRNRYDMMIYDPRSFFVFVFWPFPVCSAGASLTGWEAFFGCLLIVVE